MAQNLAQSRLQGVIRRLRSSFAPTALLLGAIIACGSEKSPSGDSTAGPEGSNGENSQTTTSMTEDGATASGESTADGAGATGADTSTSDEATTDTADTSGGEKGGSSTSSGTVTGGTDDLGDVIPSSGCTKAASPESGRKIATVGNTAREYIIQFPDDYSPAHPYPLVFGFHGMKYDAQWVAGGEDPLTGPYFGMESEAKGTAIFVAPQAASGGWSGGDIEFVETMVDNIEAEACIDEGRIFASGFSMGAIMATRLGCVLPEVFRAVAPMSGSLPSECNGADTFPSLAYLGMHGTEDTTIPISQGRLVRDSHVARNGCSDSISSPNANGCGNYTDCDQGYPVRWCTFLGEHVPFPYAGVEIWGFFSQF